MTDTRKDLCRVLKISPIAASVVAALQPAGDVHAQSNADALDEIIVTATKREMNIQDLAQSITAITSEDIARQGLDSMEDVIKAIPSMTLAADLPGRNKLVFRGMNTGDGEYRTDSQAAVYLDEQPMTSVSQQLSPRFVDMERIEALPGPQGTLFGASSQAGTIRYITNKPDPSSFSGSVDVMYSTTKGGDSSHDVSGHLNIPMSDRFAVRLVGYTVEEGGWIDNVLQTALTGLEDNADVVGTNQNEWEIQGGRLAALWNVNERWDLLATIITEESTTRGTWATDPALGDEYTAVFHDEFRVDDWTSYSLTIKGDLGFAELTSSSSWVDRTVVYEWDNHIYDAYKGAASHYGTYCAYYGPSYCYVGGLYDLDYIIGNVLNDQWQERFSQEIRLTSIGDSRFQWMAGLFYEDVTDEWFYASVTPGLASTPAFAYAQYWAYYYDASYPGLYPLPGSDFWWVQDYTRTVEQTAVFGEASFDVTDEWSVTLGGRWFENDRQRYERNTFPEGLPSWGQFATNGVDETSGTTSDTTFKFSTKYRFNDDQMVYFTASSGFRLGGYNSLRASEARFVDRVYDPDTVLNYEIGNKSTFLDGRLRVNASLYLMKWDDIQIQRWNDDEPSLWWQNGTLNGGEAESKGLELYAKALLTDNISLTASVSTGEGEYTDDIYVRTIEGVGPNDPPIYEIDTPAGTEMPFAPDLKYWVGIDYTKPGVLFGGDLWLRWDISGQADSRNGRASLEDDGSISQSDSLPSWNVSNATIGWQSESWQVNLRINNVFDKKYVQALYTGENWVAEDWYPGETRFQNLTTYNRPREISLQIRKDF